MKKSLSLALSLLLLLAALSGCAQQPSAAPETPEPPPAGTPAPEPSVTPTPAPSETPAPETPAPTYNPADGPFRFTRENFPRLDGSTACVPMAEAVCSVLLGEDRDDVQDLVRFYRTTKSYEHLMDGYCDLILASLPKASVFDEMAEAGFAYDMEQISIDALVFLVNENNPVKGLTTEQLRGIYTGEITNWKELGGEDAPIIPLQRNEGAGSQALMKKLVMGDTPLMEAPADYVPGSMGELMTTVKSYDRSANAIGYTVYYYAHDMEMAQGLKLLRIDGVAPSRESIRSGAYPHLNPYYCVIAQDTPAGSPTRILYDWLLSEEGQRLLEAEGYVTGG